MQYLPQLLSHFSAYRASISNGSPQRKEVDEIAVDLQGLTARPAALTDATSQSLFTKIYRAIQKSISDIKQYTCALSIVVVLLQMEAVFDADIRSYASHSEMKPTMEAMIMANREEKATALAMLVENYFLMFRETIIKRGTSIPTVICALYNFIAGAYNHSCVAMRLLSAPVVDGSEKLRQFLCTFSLFSDLSAVALTRERCTAALQGAIRISDTSMLNQHSVKFIAERLVRMFLLLQVNREVIEHKRLGLAEDGAPPVSLICGLVKDFIAVASGRPSDRQLLTQTTPTRLRSLSTLKLLLEYGPTALLCGSSKHLCMLLTQPGNTCLKAILTSTTFSAFEGKKSDDPTLKDTQAYLKQLPDMKDHAFAVQECSLNTTALLVPLLDSYDAAQLIIRGSLNESLPVFVSDMKSYPDLTIPKITELYFFTLAVDTFLLPFKQSLLYDSIYARDDMEETLEASVLNLYKVPYEYLRSLCECLSSKGIYDTYITASEPAHVLKLDITLKLHLVAGSYMLKSLFSDSLYIYKAGALFHTLAAGGDAGRLALAKSIVSLTLRSAVLVLYTSLVILFKNNVNAQSLDNEFTSGHKYLKNAIYTMHALRNGVGEDQGMLKRSKQGARQLVKAMSYFASTFEGKHWDTREYLRFCQQDSPADEENLSAHGFCMLDRIYARFLKRNDASFGALSPRLHAGRHSNSVVNIRKAPLPRPPSRFVENDPDNVTDTVSIGTKASTKQQYTLFTEDKLPSAQDQRMLRKVVSGIFEETDEHDANSSTAGTGMPPVSRESRGSHEQHSADSHEHGLRTAPEDAGIPLIAHPGDPCQCGTLSFAYMLFIVFKLHPADDYFNKCFASSVVYLCLEAFSSMVLGLLSLYDADVGLGLDAEFDQLLAQTPFSRMCGHVLLFILLVDRECTASSLFFAALYYRLLCVTNCSVARLAARQDPSGGPASGSAPSQAPARGPTGSVRVLINLLFASVYIEYSLTFRTDDSGVSTLLALLRYSELDVRLFAAAVTAERFDIGAADSVVLAPLEGCDNQASSTAASLLQNKKVNALVSASIELLSNKAVRASYSQKLRLCGDFLLHAFLGVDLYALAAAPGPPAAGPPALEAHTLRMYIGVLAHILIATGNSVARQNSIPPLIRGFDQNLSLATGVISSRQMLAQTILCVLEDLDAVIIPVMSANVLQFKVVSADFEGSMSAFLDDRDMFLEELGMSSPSEALDFIFKQHVTNQRVFIRDLRSYNKVFYCYLHILEQLLSNGCVELGVAGLSSLFDGPATKILKNLTNFFILTKTFGAFAAKIERAVDKATQAYITDKNVAAHASITLSNKLLHGFISTVVGMGIEYMEIYSNIVYIFVNNALAMAEARLDRRDAAATAEDVCWAVAEFDLSSFIQHLQEIFYYDELFAIAFRVVLDLMYSFGCYYASFRPRLAEAGRRVVFPEWVLLLEFLSIAIDKMNEVASSSEGATLKEYSEDLGKAIAYVATNEEENYLLRTMTDGNVCHFLAIMRFLLSFEMDPSLFASIFPMLPTQELRMVCLRELSFACFSTKASVRAGCFQTLCDILRDYLCGEADSGAAAGALELQSPGYIVYVLSHTVFTVLLTILQQMKHQAKKLIDRWTASLAVFIPQAVELLILVIEAKLLRHVSARDRDDSHGGEASWSNHGLIYARSVVSGILLYLKDVAPFMPTVNLLSQFFIMVSEKPINAVLFSALAYSPSCGLGDGQGCADTFCAAEFHNAVQALAGSRTSVYESDCVVTRVLTQAYTASRTCYLPTLEDMDAVALNDSALPSIHHESKASGAPLTSRQSQLSPAPQPLTVSAKDRAVESSGDGASLYVLNKGVFAYIREMIDFYSTEFFYKDHEFFASLLEYLTSRALPHMRERVDTVLYIIGHLEKFYSKRDKNTFTLLGKPATVDRNKELHTVSSLSTISALCLMLGYTIESQTIAEFNYCLSVLKKIAMTTYDMLNITVIIQAAHLYFLRVTSANDSVSENCELFAGSLHKFLLDVLDCLLSTGASRTFLISELVAALADINIRHCDPDNLEALVGLVFRKDLPLEKLVLLSTLKRLLSDSFDTPCATASSVKHLTRLLTTAVTGSLRGILPSSDAKLYELGDIKTRIPFYDGRRSSLLSGTADCDGLCTYNPTVIGELFQRLFLTSNSAVGLKKRGTPVSSAGRIPSLLESTIEEEDEQQGKVSGVTLAARVLGQCLAKKSLNTGCDVIWRTIPFDVPRSGGSTVDCHECYTCLFDYALHVLFHFASYPPSVDLSRKLEKDSIAADDDAADALHKIVHIVSSECVTTSVKLFQQNVEGTILEVRILGGCPISYWIQRNIFRFMNAFIDCSFSNTDGLPLTTPNSIIHMYTTRDSASKFHLFLVYESMLQFSTECRMLGNTDEILQRYLEVLGKELRT